MGSLPNTKSVSFDTAPMEISNPFEVLEVEESNTDTEGEEIDTNLLLEQRWKKTGQEW